LGESAVVDAVVVVEAQVGVQLAPETAVTGIEVASECRSPALVEDRLVQRLDVTVGLWSAGVDPGVTGFQGDRALCPPQPADVEAVDPDQLTGL
jgi:hypothetical protein